MYEYKYEFSENFDGEYEYMYESIIVLTFVLLFVLVLVLSDDRAVFRRETLPLRVVTHAVALKQIWQIFV